MLGALPALLPRWPRPLTLVGPRWLRHVEIARAALAAAIPRSWREPLLRNRREIAATCLATIGIALFAVGAGLV